MANSFELNDRKVLPNWRPLNNNLVIKELIPSIIPKREHTSSDYFNAYKEAWQVNKKISIAGDLLNAAYINDIRNDPIIIEVAEYVIKHKDKSSNLLYDFASKILYPERKNEEDIRLNDCNLIPQTREHIKAIKQKLKRFENDEILYVELSRLYSIIGRNDKAKKYMQIALGLSKENRFVLRAAIRLYSHMHQFDEIYKYIGDLDITKRDPWILAADISLSQILNKSPRYYKLAISMIKSQKYSPFSLTELQASLGTAEMMAGKISQAKKFFKSALLDPNDNSLAQISWINTNNNRIIDFNPYSYKIKNIYEALTFEYYQEKRWNEALNYSKKWYWDMPYSKTPGLFYSLIAGTFLGEYKKATQMLGNIFISHSDDAMIINNLAYFLALDDQVGEAEKIINFEKKCSMIKDSTKICIKATRGLIEFRKKNYEIGRKLYQEAIMDAGEQKNHQYAKLALLNWIKEELKIVPVNPEIITNELLNYIESIPYNSKEPSVEQLQKEILDILRNKKYTYY